MIGFLRGTLLEQEASYLIVEVNGIGYEIQIPLNNFATLPPLGQEISLYIHFIAREDGQFLYGFINKNSRSLFRALIKVNGVGPKMALTILSAMEPDVFARNILLNDTAALEHISGIGSKTAKRLLIEMRDKVIEWGDTGAMSVIKSGTVMDDAVSALIALGYKAYEAKKAVLKHKDKDLPSEDLVRLALKEIK